MSKKDTQIHREDQLKINQFSRLNMKQHELKDDIKKLKEELDNLEDATMMIEESMGEDLKLFVGEAMIEVDEDRATKYVEKMQEEKQTELEELQDELEKTEDECKSLKAHLYARFGSSINLEEEA